MVPDGADAVVQVENTRIVEHNVSRLLFDHLYNKLTFFRYFITSKRLFNCFIANFYSHLNSNYLC